MTQWTYFAADGTYGDADQLIVVDTTDWTEYEWETIALGEPNTGFLQLAEHIAVAKDNYLVYVSAELPNIARKGVSYDC